MISKKRSSPPSKLSRHPLLFALLSLQLASCEPFRGPSVVDDLGRTVALSRPPSRVVSLAPNVTEMIVAAGGGKRLVGTDSFSDFPAEVRRLPKVGDMEPNVELIARLRPDMVFAVGSAGHASLARSLSSTGTPLFLIRTDRLEDVPRNIARFGELFGTADAARAAIVQFRERMERLRRSRARKPQVLFAVWLDPLYVAGTETFVDDLLGVVGGRNAVPSNGWPQYSLENVVAAPPDILVIASGSRSVGQLRSFLGRTSPWNELAAVKSGFWYVVNEDRFARAGPRMPEAAEDLSRIIDTWERSQ